MWPPAWEVASSFVGPDIPIGPLGGSLCAGNFAAYGRRVSFPAMGKKPKDRRGTAQTKRRPGASIRLTPVPHLRGPQLGGLGNQRKGAGGQGIGFRSMTATAEDLVTFEPYFYRLEARLLADSGSNAAQGNGVS